MADNESEAWGRYEWLAANQFTGQPHDHFWMLNLALSAITCSVLGDAPHAAMLYELMLPYCDQNVPVTRLAPGNLDSMSHYLGLLAATTARWDDAAGHFEAAIQRHTRMGALSLLALSHYQYAHVLLARGRPGDKQRAAAYLRQARDAARSFDMRLWPDRLTVSLESSVHEAVFSRQGEYWTVVYQTTTFQLKNTIGLGYLARLLQAPGHEFHALHLATPGQAISVGDAGEALDDRAKAAYRRRLDDLAEELDEAEQWNDPERAARARAEIDALTEQLASAVGLGGRNRRAASDAERARSSVSKAIKSAINRIAAHDPALGDHLAHSVKTGTFCVYDPDPTALLTWKVCN
jgi:tetratricopeptide (TPR) repeat protein